MSRPYVWRMASLSTRLTRHRPLQPLAAAATAAATAAAGYSSVFLWAAGVAILIAPLALLLITITKETFSGSDENQPIHLG